MLSILRQNRDLLAVNLVLMVVASLAATGTFEFYRNTLSRHPEWKSTKTTLQRQVMGAIAYVSDTRALARNQLDLGAWFGFQEVIYQRPLDLAELEASVRVEPQGYVNVLYGIEPDGFLGLRFSNRHELTSIHFRANPSGAFIAVDTLRLPTPLSPNVWHSVRLEFRLSETTVELDGRPVGSFEPSAGPQRIGFRGGQRKAWVDDVVLRMRHGATIRETFTNTWRVTEIGVTTFAGLMMVSGLAALVAWWRTVSMRKVGLAMTVASMLLLVGIGTAYLYQMLRPRRYPIASASLKGVEGRWIQSRKRQVLENLRRMPPHVEGEETYRILFLGSSQTWGAGAAATEEVWVHQLEILLNTGSGERHYECMNAGLPGLTAASTLAFLHDLLRFAPQAAVIDLSNNDVDTVSFRSNLDSLVATLTTAGIQPILLLEPNSPERRITDSRHGDLSVKHDIVRGIGASRGVPVIDLHGYLMEWNATGFLWWDFVHLTSYGQRLVAEKLSTELPPLLGSPRRGAVHPPAARPNRETHPRATEGPGVG